MLQMRASRGVVRHPCERHAEDAEDGEDDDQSDDAEAEVNQVPYKKPSPGEGKNPSPSDGKNPSPHDGKHPSPHDGKHPSPQDGKNPSPPDRKNPSPGDRKQPPLDVYSGDESSEASNNDDDNDYRRRGHPDDWRRWQDRLQDDRRQEGLAERFQRFQSTQSPNASSRYTGQEYQSSQALLTTVRAPARADKLNDITRQWLDDTRTYLRQAHPGDDDVNRVRSQFETGVWAMLRTQFETPDVFEFLDTLEQRYLTPTRAATLSPLVNMANIFSTDPKVSDQILANISNAHRADGQQLRRTTGREGGVDPAFTRRYVEEVRRLSNEHGTHMWTALYQKC